VYTDTTEILEQLNNATSRKGQPSASWYMPALENALSTLELEDYNYRPYAEQNGPGGLIYLKKDIPTIIVPDLHARTGFIRALVNWSFSNDSNPVIELLQKGGVQIVCLGDGVHSEARAADRWRKALIEYSDGFKKHKHMDAEIRESFGLMEMIMILKSAYPSHFHFLKGNHENIANERADGNLPFRKFAMEGSMFRDYTEMFLGEEFFNMYYRFEKNLPLLTIGNNFLVSHSEPAAYHSREEIINYRHKSAVVKDFTWTANDEAEEGSVEAMLKEFFPEAEPPLYYFGGHRPVSGTYATRASGRYIQLHNPDRYIIAAVPSNNSFDPNQHILDIRE